MVVGKIIYFSGMDARKKEKILGEVTFRTGRSSGPGGQAVNKLSTRVELIFKVEESSVLTEREKKRLLLRLKNRISKEGILVVAAEDQRSQYQNKELAKERFIALLDEALKEPKKRIKTGPTKSSVEKRLKEKKIRSDKKSLRKPPQA